MAANSYINLPNYNMTDYSKEFIKISESLNLQIHVICFTGKSSLIYFSYKINAHYSDRLMAPDCIISKCLIMLSFLLLHKYYIKILAASYFGNSITVAL